jgi:hypothetical protein
MLQVLRLHSQAVRDIKASQSIGTENQLLSTAFDSTLSVYDLSAQQKVLSWQLPRKGCSCSWSATNPLQVLHVCICALALLTRMHSTHAML